MGRQTRSAEGSVVQIFRASPQVVQKSTTHTNKDGNVVFDSLFLHPCKEQPSGLHPARRAMCSAASKYHLVMVYQAIVRIKVEVPDDCKNTHLRTNKKWGQFLVFQDVIKHL